MSTIEEIAIQTWSVRRELKADPEDTLDWIASLGVSSIEVANLGELAPAQFLDLCERRAIRVVATHIPLNLDCPSDRAADRIVRRCEALNTPVFVFWTPQQLVRTEEAYKQLALYVIKLSKHISSRVRIVFHPYDYDYASIAGGGSSGLDVMEVHGLRDHVELEFDTHFASSAGDLDEYLDRYDSWITHFHLNDITEDKHQAPIGTGTLNWTKILPRLSPQNKSRPLIIEHKTATPKQWIETSLETLNTLLSTHS